MPFAFFLLTGCRYGAQPGTLVIAIETLPQGFDPRTSTTSSSSARIMQLVYDTLVVKDANFEIVPSLATFEPPERDNFKRFTFHLRPGVVFHNGKPLTSADVKYTFDSLLDPAFKSPIRGSVDKITQIETPDPLTVIFHANEPFYAFMGNLPAIGIIPEGAGVEMSSAPVGSGPFKFISYTEGDGVRLEANQSYWGGAPRIARVQIRVIPDNSTRQAALMSGEVDLAYNAQFDPETVRALSQRSDIQVVVANGANIGYLGLNLSSPKLQNQKLRKAIAYAIDRDVIIHELLRDQARKADAIMPPEHWAYNPNITVYNHDPERARALLDEAGLIDPDGDGPEPRVRLSILTSTAQLPRNIAVIMQDQLRSVGIQLDIVSLELATMFSRLSKADYELYYLIGLGFNQSTDVFQFVYKTGGVQNRMRYSNPQVDAWIDEAARLTERAAQKEVYWKIQKTISEDLPQIYLWYPANVLVARKRVGNIQLDPSGSWYFIAKLTLE
ncbi:MAG TPA: ABC transporter substrate-binding protein [Blastocatellia bacterium]|nr:ABC transporter substrate-binding protein [Blastocatellia bacterium]